MHPSNQKKLLDKYKGRPIKDAIYALDVALGYYECKKIYHEARRLKCGK